MEIKMIVLVILGIYLTAIALIGFQGYCQEKKLLKDKDNFVFNIIKHVPCPKCSAKNDHKSLKFIGEYKIYIKCKNCGSEWYTTYK